MSFYVNFNFNDFTFDEFNFKKFAVDNFTFDKFSFDEFDGPTSPTLHDPPQPSATHTTTAPFCQRNTLSRRWVVLYLCSNKI